MPDHHNALPAGYRLGEYEIQTVLGSGGFGVTYKAHDHNLDKAVAIKEYLPPEFAVRDGRTTVKPKSSASKDDYAWGLDRFLDEARALARFDHPHINKVYRFFKENGTAYLVLEYIEGDMLSDLLNDKGRFNEAGVRRMLDELLDGLAAVHKAGYIHRDVKPANIIFRRDGSAVLLDFGAARQAIGKRSQAITSILTPGYAPVEQYLQSIDAMGAWTDLYSLGVVAYRCLVGGDESVLIDAPSRAHFAKRGEIDKDMPLAVNVGKGKYAKNLLGAIDWAMKVDEGNRPQSVEELQVALLIGVENAHKLIAKHRKVNESKLESEQAAFLQLIGSNASPDGVNRSGEIYPQSHLSIAAAHGWAALVKWLIDNGAEVNKYVESFIPMDDLEPTTLHEAAEGNFVDAAKVLLANGAQIDAKDFRGDTPLCRAAEENSFEFVDWLLANGARVNGNSYGNSTPLHRATTGNFVDVAKLLLANDAEVNAKTRDGDTPLHEAAQHDSIDVAKLLLANGALINSTDNYGATPLYDAAQHDSIGVAKLLLASGILANSTDNDGATPLHVAALRNSPDVAKALIANGAPVNSNDHYGQTPLHATAARDSIKVGKLLLANDAEINAKETDGQTPLHFAARTHSTGIAELLIANGADTEAQGNDGLTALHIAAKRNFVDIVKLLLTNGAKVNAKNANGDTPLQLVKRQWSWFYRCRYRRALITQLKRHGAQ